MARNIHVGTFSRNSNSVPVTMRGAAVYYAPDLRKFAIVDRNSNKTLNFFEMPQYRTFVDAGVLELDPNTSGYMEDEYQRWHDEQEAQVATDIEQDAMSDGNDDGYEPPVITQGDRPETMDFDGNGRPRSKDPTRHLRGYFVTIFILTLMAVLGRTVLLPVIMKLLEIS